MSYLIYDKTNNNKIVELVRYRPYRRTSSYKTHAAAKAALTRMSNEYWKKVSINSKYEMNTDPQFIYGIAESEHYYKTLEKKVKKVNMMTGKEYWESVNTPHYCSPSSETYWSM